jgi:hypothetical protein
MTPIQMVPHFSRLHDWVRLEVAILPIADVVPPHLGTENGFFEHENLVIQPQSLVARGQQAERRALTDLTAQSKLIKEQPKRRS